MATVHAIEKGLAHSTHLLGVLSPDTMGSWWVPFEIGSARARGYETVHLLVAMPDLLPEYIRICENFREPAELFKWSSSLAHWPGSLINRYYAEWLAEGSPFIEIGPGEDLVEYWYESAEWENKEQLSRLADALRL